MADSGGGMSTSAPRVQLFAGAGNWWSHSNNNTVIIGRNG